MNTISENIPVTDNLSQIASRELQFFEEDLHKIAYAGGNNIKIGADIYPMDIQAWSTLSGYLALPSSLLPQLNGNLGNIVLQYLHKVGRRAPNAPKHLRLYYTEQNQIMAVNNANLACLSNEEVVNVIEDTLPSNILSQILSARCVLTDTEFELDCFTKTLVTEPRPGDILYGGIQIRHSQAGLFPTVVLAYVHRLVCRNGMTQRICLGGKPARIKRCKSSNSKEAMLESIHNQLKGAVEQVKERLDGKQWPHAS